MASVFFLDHDSCPHVDLDTNVTALYTSDKTFCLNDSHHPRFITKNTKDNHFSATTSTAFQTGRLTKFLDENDAEKRVPFRRFDLRPALSAEEEKKLTKEQIEKDQQEKRYPFFHATYYDDACEFNFGETALYDIFVIPLQNKNMFENQIFVDAASGSSKLRSVDTLREQALPWVMPPTSTVIFWTAEKTKAEPKGDAFQLAKKHLPGRNVHLAKTNEELWTHLLDAVVAKFYSTKSNNLVPPTKRLITTDLQVAITKRASEYIDNDDSSDDDNKNDESNSSSSSSTTSSLPRRQKEATRAILSETIDNLIPRSWRTTPSIYIMHRNHFKGRRVTCKVLEGIVTEKMQFNILCFPSQNCVVELQHVKQPHVMKPSEWKVHKKKGGDSCNDSDFSDQEDEDGRIDPARKMQDYDQKFPMLPGTIFIATLTPAATPQNYSAHPGGEENADFIKKNLTHYNDRLAKSTSKFAQMERNNDEFNRGDGFSGTRVQRSFAPGSTLRALPWNLQRNKEGIFEQASSVGRINDIIQCGKAIIKQQQTATAASKNENEKEDEKTKLTKIDPLLTHICSNLLFAFPSNAFQNASVTLELVFDTREQHLESLKMFSKLDSHDLKTCNSDVFVGVNPTYSLHTVIKVPSAKEQEEYEKTHNNRPAPIFITFYQDDDAEPPGLCTYLGPLVKKKINIPDIYNNSDDEKTFQHHEVECYVSAEEIEQNNNDKKNAHQQKDSSSLSSTTTKQVPAHLCCMIRTSGSNRHPYIGRVVSLSSVEGHQVDEFYLGSDNNKNGREMTLKSCGKNFLLDPSFVPSYAKLLRPTQVLGDNNTKMSQELGLDNFDATMKTFLERGGDNNNNNNFFVLGEEGAKLREARAEHVLAHEGHQFLALFSTIDEDVFLDQFLCRNLLPFEYFVERFVLDNAVNRDQKHYCANKTASFDDTQANKMLKYYRRRHEKSFQQDQQQQGSNNNNDNGKKQVATTNNNNNTITFTIPSLLEWVIGCWLPPFPQEVKVNRSLRRQFLTHIKNLFEHDAPFLPPLSAFSRLMTMFVRRMILHKYSQRFIGGLLHHKKELVCIGQDYTALGFLLPQHLVRSRAILFKDDSRERSLPDVDLVRIDNNNNNSNDDYYYDDGYLRAPNPALLDRRIEVGYIFSIADGAARCGNLKLVSSISNFICNIVCSPYRSPMTMNNNNNDNDNADDITGSWKSIAPNWGEKLHSICPKSLFPKDKLGKPALLNALTAKREDDQKLVPPRKSVFGNFAPKSGKYTSPSSAATKVPTAKNNNNNTNAPKEFPSFDLTLAYLMLNKQSVFNTPNELAECISTVALNQIRMHSLGHQDQPGMLFKHNASCLKNAKNKPGCIFQDAFVEKKWITESKTLHSSEHIKYCPGGDRAETPRSEFPVLNLIRLVTKFSCYSAGGDLPPTTPISYSILCWFVHQCLRKKLALANNGDENLIRMMTIVHHVISYLIE